MRNLVFVLLAAITLPACATITTSADHSLSVVTDPPGAACELRRRGEVIGVVNPTPGTVRIGKSTRDIAIACARPGNVRGATTVEAGFQPMFLGNILLGGLIGMGVDVISGAGATYPNTAYVSLRPVEGDTPAAPPSPSPTPPIAALPPSGSLVAATAAQAAVAPSPAASMSLEQYVDTARRDCQRRRGRNCEAAAEAAVRDYESAWQSRRRDVAAGRI